MRKLQMVDLKSQYEKIKDAVDHSIQDVLNTSTYINGPLVKEFQEDLEKMLSSAIEMTNTQMSRKQKHAI